MKKSCAWCGAGIGMVEGTEVDERITHGICVRCLGMPEFQWRGPLSRFLESLSHPVLRVDEDSIRAINKQSCRALGTSSPCVGETPDEEVFECGQKFFPGACGRKVCCSGCAIRQAIAWTHETGDSLFSVPAVLDKSCPDDLSAATLRITTMKMMGVVILRMEKVETSSNVPGCEMTELLVPWG